MTNTSKICTEFSNHESYLLQDEMKQILSKSSTYFREILERMYEKDLYFTSGKTDFKKKNDALRGYWDKFCLYQ